MSRIKKALEKAENSRKEIFESAQETSRVSKRREIQPQYIQTKVIPVAPHILKRHKIFGFFEEGALTEELRILHTRILDEMEKFNGNTLMVTSALPGEGKTFTAINLGLSIAREFDRTVLLVDANFKNPSVHSYLGLSVEKGLAHVLLREAQIPEVLVNPNLPRFVVLPAGKSLTGSAEILGSPYAESIFLELKTRYPERFIIIDAPSLRSADPLVLSDYADAILLVVEAERTTDEDLLSALGMFKEKPLLMVLNKLRI